MKKLIKVIDNLTLFFGFGNKELTRFLRYNLAAGVATFIDIFLYWIAVAFLGISYLISGTVTFSIGLLVNYSLNRVWGFKGTKRRILHGFLYFFLVGVTALVIALFFLAFFVEVMGINYLVARILVVLIVMPWNYFLNAILTFKQPRA